MKGKKKSRKKVENHKNNWKKKEDTERSNQKKTKNRKQKKTELPTADTKRYRRHSAPENLGQWFVPHQGRHSLPGAEDWSRASVSDFSVLLEKQSESGSSLELDTSNLSRDLSPEPNTRSSPRDSYQSFPIDFGTSEEFNPNKQWQGFGSWPVWKCLLLSQAIAGCVAVMDVSNAGLKSNSHNLMTNGQNLLHYILLGVLWSSKLALRNNGRDMIQVIKYSGLRYLFLSVLHVEANYLLLSSFHHNTYLGNQMIDCVAACLCLAIAYVCLEVQFHLTHASGFVFTMVGAVGLFIANIMHGRYNPEGALLGDVLRIASGICLAFNSIAQEIIVKSIDFVEYLGMIGLIGSFICGFQEMTLETNKVIPRSSTYWQNVFTYCMAQFLFNSLTPKVLNEMGSTGLHLALTASEFYSYFIGVISQREKLHFLYLMSYAVTLTGSILFFVKRTVIGAETFYPVKITIIKDPSDN